jgi:hypothetical protein
MSDTQRVPAEGTTLKAPLRVEDAAGRLMLEVTTAEERPRLHLFDREGRRRIILAVEDEGTALELVTTNGASAVVLYESAGVGGSLLLSRPDPEQPASPAQEIALHAFEHGQEPSILLSDYAKDSRLTLQPMPAEQIPPPPRRAVSATRIFVDESI